MSWEREVKMTRDFLKLILLTNLMLGLSLAILVAFVFYHNGFVWEPDDGIRAWEFGFSIFLAIWFLAQIPFWFLWAAEDKEVR